MVQFPPAAPQSGWEESPASSDVNETDAVEASPASLGEEVRPAPVGCQFPIMVIPFKQF